MKVLFYISCMLLVYSVSAKPPKVKVETEEEEQFKEYVELYNDSQIFSAYIDSLVKTYNFCFSNDTDNVLVLRSDIIGKNNMIATYIDGTPALMDFLLHTVRYPSISRENGVEGKAILKFMVKEDGEICNVSVYKQQGIGLAEEAIRVLSLIKDKWKPAIINNQKVKSYVMFPITFKIH